MNTLKIDSMQTQRCLPSRCQWVNQIFVWVCCACLAFLPGMASAQGLNGAFEAAITSAQQRMVKVYGATAGQVDGYASGILVSKDGLVITMQGVYLDGQNTRVVMPDGTTHTATVLRRQRELQLALLKIDIATPNFFELSDKPVGRKGDWVLTLSNAFKVADGVEWMSVNLGVISLRTKMDARLNTRDVAYSGELVLIDAITSNPGAGGGAVVTVDGELVGSIGRIINSSETNTRINYSVPSRILKQFVSGDLQRMAESTAPQSTGEPGDLGIRLFTLGGRNQPAYIDRIARNSPAHAMKLRPDDLIISLNGEKIGNVREFQEMMKTISAGDEVIMIVKRKRDLLRLTMTASAKK
ncbi:MAG: trypsin-like peptidase domain-containing protein [Pirellulaceae bacterium]|nr:trypsin-like peptidase domain-containing protein [Pirellulaceae bacterium]